MGPIGIAITAAVVALAVYLERRERLATRTIREDVGDWAARQPGRWSRQDYVVLRRDVEVTVSSITVDHRSRRSMIVVRAATATGHDPPRLHRGAWHFHRLPLAVDVDDEPRACCVRANVTAPHAIASDGRAVVAWMEAGAQPDSIDAIVDEVATIARERPLLDDPERIDPSRGGPFR
jgi:hypothetical protein